MATSNIQNLKEKNDAYATNFKHGDLPLPPAKKYLVVVCHRGGDPRAMREQI